MLIVEECDFTYYIEKNLFKKQNIHFLKVFKENILHYLVKTIYFSFASYRR